MPDPLVLRINDPSHRFFESGRLQSFLPHEPTVAWTAPRPGIASELPAAARRLGLSVGDEGYPADRLPLAEAVTASLLEGMRDWIEPVMFRELIRNQNQLQRASVVFSGKLSGSTALFHPEKGVVEIGPAPIAPGMLVHELFHFVDSAVFVRGGRQRKATGNEDMFGRDCWASHDEGRIGDLVREVKRAYKPQLLSIVSDLTSRDPKLADLPAAVRDPLLAGETVPMADAMAAFSTSPGFVQDALEARMPFGGASRSGMERAFLKHGAPSEGVDAALFLFRMLPIGVPLSMYDRPEEERLQYAKGLSLKNLSDKLREYWLAPHEVFARLCDQAYRVWAAAEGKGVGLAYHPGDLPRDVFREVGPQVEEVIRHYLRGREW